MITEPEIAVEPNEPDTARCSTVSRMLDEPLTGTAAAATTWLCLEQPGPWGPDALLESRLDTAVGNELANRVAGTGVRISLIRRPGRSRTLAAEPSAREVYLAHTVPGSTWTEHAVITDPADLLELDFVALGTGHPPGFGTRTNRTMALVCTNGRRDQCCARLGRDVAGRLEAAYGEVVWECTHTGGHRFAPTGVTLPLGYLYGRLDGRDGMAGHRLVDAPARGEVVLEGCRGRSTWSPVGQVAELAVRERTGENRADVVRVDTVEQANPDLDPDHAAEGTIYAVQVSHTDTRAWRVAVAEHQLRPPRPTSCGGDQKSPMGLTVLSVDTLESTSHNRLIS